VTSLLRVLASRWTRLVLVAMLAAAVQATLAADVRAWGVAAQPVLLLAVAVGAAHGPADGLLAGFTVGLVADLAFGDVIGLGAVALGAAGVSAGLLVAIFRDPPWWVRVGAMVVASALGEAYVPVLKTLVGIDGWIRPRMALVAAVVAAMHLVVAPAVLPLGRWVMRETSEEVA
jgi:rod shape-determining protein MreD